MATELCMGNLRRGNQTQNKQLPNPGSSVPDIHHPANAHPQCLCQIATIACTPVFIAGLMNVKAFHCIKEFAIADR